MQVMRCYSEYFCIIFLVLLLVACSRTFMVKPSGNLNDGVIFYFYTAINDKAPSEFSIVDFVVQKKVAEKEWIAVWGLTGKQALEKIEYGRGYGDLQEIVPAKRLEKGELYRVLVSEISFSKPKGFSGSIFSIDDNGKVVVKENSEH